MASRPLSRVPVAVPAETSEYGVLIGSGGLAGLAGTARAAVHARRWAIITDRTVGELYGAAVLESFAREDQEADLVAFHPGEASKTRRTWSRLCDGLLRLGIGRDAGIVALGGGVVGDMAGFVAATYMRGLPLVQAPTTLLAMVDAAVGGKTGIDLPAGKNLVGAFKWPAVVVADPDVLATLPDDVFRAGLAEAVKHAAIADAAHLAWLEASAAGVLAQEPATLAELIRRSVEIKAAVVEDDPLESGRRAILNFGHTVAHALERLSDYAIPHGFAVAIGLVIEARLGERLGVTKPGTEAALTRVLSRFGLPVSVPAGVRAEQLAARARFDKKNRRAEIRCSLIAEPGVPLGVGSGEWTRAVSDADLRAALAPGGAEDPNASGNSL